MADGVQLLAYADRFGGDIARLDSLLRRHFAGCFAGVHLLPFFYPIDGADAGFDPIDHCVVDARLGTWDDLRSLSAEIDVTADLVVNHISAESREFADFQKNGSRSAYADLFLTAEKVFPSGVTVSDRAAIYRPRPTDPFLPCELATGEQVNLWTTFTPQQLDLDVSSTSAQNYLRKVVQVLAEGGVRTVRLDAIGYAVKKQGTSCYMLPETFEFMELVASWVRELGMTSLAELHAHYEHQLRAARHVDCVYDFALPPLVLHALGENISRPLKDWFAISPRNAVTVLDTHDGIGVMDVGADPMNRSLAGLLSPDAIDRLVERIHRNSGGVSKQASRKDVGNLDLYQVNCTYYDALGRNDQDYLLARAIQFFAPGTPQVYYVGLLAGENDIRRLQATAQGREVNRSYYDEAAVLQNLERPVVQSLLNLIRFRNSFEAFRGECEVCESSDSELLIRRSSGRSCAELYVDFESRDSMITCEHRGTTRTYHSFDELP